MKIDHSYHNVFFICEKVTGSAERKSVKGTQIFDKMEKTTPKASNIFAPLPVSIKKSGKKVKQKKNVFVTNHMNSKCQVDGIFH